MSNSVASFYFHLNLLIEMIILETTTKKLNKQTWMLISKKINNTFVLF